MTTLWIVLILAFGALSVVFYVRWQRAETEKRALEESARREAELRSQTGEAARRERGEMQAAFRAEFQLLAGRIFEEKSATFKTTNRESLEGLLKPFRDNLTDFRKRVEDIYSEENRQHGALRSELGRLMDLNRRITEQTSNLTSALRGQSKVQGDWGEMILERMLESSNLQKGVHYFVQETFRDESGASLRPDIILALPEGKRIVIDSKVSLTAWVDYTAASESDSGSDPGSGPAGNAAAREAALKRHVASVRQHISDLHARNYQGVVADSPDFVIMFVAGEPAFVAALQADNTLWTEGYNKRVIISSPTNLFALLRIVDDLWKRDSQGKHALEIARQGGALYDKFVGFVSSLEDVGRNLDRAQKSYDHAYGQLSAGKGNLVGQAERLRKMGVKATKKLPAALADNLPDDDAPEPSSDPSSNPSPDHSSTPSSNPLSGPSSGPGVKD